MLRLFSFALACVLLSFPMKAGELPSDDVFDGIEARITAAMNNSFMKRNLGPLETLRAEIASVETAEHRRAAIYWTAYTDFNIAIFQLKSRKASLATKIVKAAVSSLDELKGKNAEELALLAFLQDFTVQFVPEEEREALSTAATDNVQQALALDEENMRAQYINGRIAYYDMDEKTAEACLLRAIELPANKSGDATLPGWGKAEAYELLTQFYLKNKSFDSAEATLNAGLEQFPDNYQLSVLVPKVKAGGK